jgi:hypothetical protein
MPLFDSAKISVKACLTWFSLDALIAATVESSSESF